MRHVKLVNRRCSTSKVVYAREWAEVQKEKLIHWLNAHYGVLEIKTEPESDVQVRLIVHYKFASKSSEEGLARARSVDGFIGGWMGLQEENKTLDRLAERGEK